MLVNSGHAGTGDLEIRIQTAADLERGAATFCCAPTMERDFVGRP
jgi:hypothetical protein